MPKPLDIVYRAIVTTAPDSYDYGYVIPVPPQQMTFEALPDAQLYMVSRALEQRQVVRGVLVPVEHADRQLARYESGTYLAFYVEA